MVMPAPACTRRQLPRTASTQQRRCPSLSPPLRSPAHEPDLQSSSEWARENKRGSPAVTRPGGRQLTSPRGTSPVLTSCPHRLGRAPSRARRAVFLSYATSCNDHGRGCATERRGKSEAGAVVTGYSVTVRWSLGVFGDDAALCGA